VKKHSKTQAPSSAARTKAKSSYSRKKIMPRAVKNQDSSRKKHPLPTPKTELQQHPLPTPPTYSLKVETSKDG
jgi:hypothetical protein